jgi:hypothetical protein
MSLKFGRNEIPGIHGPLVFGSWEVSRREAKFFQVRGVAEVAGERGARSIAVRHLLHDGYVTEAKLQAVLEAFSDLVGTNDTLQEESDIDGGPERKLNYCTFEGWEPIPLNGQEDPGPLYDIAGTLDTNGGWFRWIVLRWRQLRG